MYRHFFLLVAVLFCISLANAEQVTLNNGDHVTGTVVKFDGKVLTLKTEFAGTIDIQWSAVKELVSTDALYVTTKSNEKPIGGKVEAHDEIFVVTPPAAPPVTVAKNEVTAVRTASDQAAFEGTLHRSLLKGWDGGVNVGFALTGGNSDTTNLSIAFTGNRKTGVDKISLYANTLYATNHSPGAFPTTTANNIQGGARYDRNIGPRLFSFANTDFMSDSLQELDLRSTFGGGLGVHAIKGERTTLDFLGGGNFTHETYTTFTRNLGTGTLGQELQHKFGGTELHQKLYFFPDLTNRGDYRAWLDFGTVTKINKHLGWQNTFSDIYVSSPPVGTKKNDLVFTTGLNISFKH